MTSAPWLRLSAYSGKGSSSVDVTIVPEELPAGEQQGTIWLGSQQIDVTVTGGIATEEPEAAATPESTPTEAPAPTPTPTTAPSPTPTATPAPMTLVADPASLRFTVMAGEVSTAQQITLDRSGGAFEPWTLSTETPWLQLSEPDMDLPATVDVTVDATNLPPGEHASVITSGELSIPVSVVVLDPTKGRTAIDDIWAYYDFPVSQGMVARTWLWGPAPLAEMREPYAGAPGGDRLVVYYDKGRLEVTDPLKDPSDPTYVTNGLLAKELITGKIQLGDDEYEQRAPADIPVAGDLSDPDSPRYASFTSLVDAAPLQSWSVVTQTLNGTGEVGDNPSLARHNVIVTEPDPVTNHTVASVFLEYFLSGGGVWVDGGFTWEPLFDDWHTMIGLPITEPFWSQVTANGEEVNILMQCFERRCLTWTPSYQEEWRVEQANVGAAYLQWRYQGQLP